MDIFDISGSSGATDVKSAANDAATGSIADKMGNLEDGVKAAEYCQFLDFNVNSELGKFGLHNGGAQDAGLLNEKWEGLALAPVDGKGEFFFFFLFFLSFWGGSLEGFFGGGLLFWRPPPLSSSTLPSPT